MSAQKLLEGLRSFDVSAKSGFVPEQASPQLPKAFDQLEDLIQGLPKLLLDKESFLRKVEALPELDIGQLRTQTDLQRAYVLLAFTIHSLHHGCKLQNIPSKLASPFLALCDGLGVQPVLSYAGLCLFNYVEDSTSPLGLKPIATFTGTVDEEAFYMVPVLVERVGGPLISELLNALVDAENGDWHQVQDRLVRTIETLNAMTAELDGLKLCQPDMFYNQIRPHIGGLNLTYLSIAASDLKVDLAGGSAAQASIFQFLDQILGIRHSGSLLLDMRQYMPRGHRQFLEQVDKLPSLETLLEIQHDQRCTELLNTCREALVKWRNKHINIVTRYIMLPAQAAARRNGLPKLQVAGTAGSSPITFLKTVRDETLSVAKLNSFVGGSVSIVEAGPSGVSTEV